ncbi:hypothetical protein G0U57_021481 [Chelydra serpentina]|uniref:Reverse transcriptase RNase H-like domain-containing protein n=1 Tax=Chelydra serpentina TaxID=8475 RepID=A0A8T1STA7_CHESE|nr:hypothetical protein G0U57_021481 [Chelydra serpentina]
METLSYYVVGRTFVLVTDHAPLQWMQRDKEKNPGVTRWFLSLQPFQFRIQHRAGSRHGNANGLSHVHCLASQAAQPLGVEQRGGLCDRPRPVGYSRVVEGRYTGHWRSSFLFPD